MSRGYTNFSGMQPFTDGWKRTVYSGPATSGHVCRPVIMESEGRKMPISHYSSGQCGESYATSDHVCRPVLMESEGRKMPISYYSPGQCGESYVVKSERILEHVPAPTVTLVAEYRCISGPGEEEMFKDYTVDKRYTRFGSGYNHPDEKVEEFLTKIQGEVSQLTKAGSSGRRTSPKWTGQEGSNKYRDDSDFKGSDWNKVNSNPARDRHIIQYNNGTYPMTSKDDEFYEWPKGYEGSNVYSHQLSKPSNNITNVMFMEKSVKPYEKGAYPMTNSKDVDEFYERPRGHEGSYVSGHQLSKPTNNNNSATEFLKESVKPTYGNGTYPMTNSKVVDEFYERPKGHEGSNVSGHQLSKPTNNINSVMEFLKESANPTYGKGTYPMTNSKDDDEFYERPKGHEGSNVSGHQLSKPTNNNNSDMEFLKESVNPTHGKGKEEFNSNTQAEGRSKTKVVPLTMRWRNGSNVPNQQNKMDSDEDDLEEQGKSPSRSKHELYRLNTGEAPKPFENKDGYEKPKVNGGHVTYIGKSSLANPQQPRLNVPSVQKKEIVHSSPEAIDSSEARRRYGKLPSPPATEEASEGTISSREAAMKYKGALIP